MPAPAAAQATQSLWDSSVQPPGPDGDTASVELGVRFRSDVSGFITGVRFYKHAENIGPHSASLWTNTGTLLASATFLNESPAGWQQALFATPVPIVANTTYVASYHAYLGKYAVSSSYFAAGFDRPPLHALRDGIDGPNGVYRYGSSAFPTDTYLASNYWIDVIFSSVVPSDTTPPLVNGITPSAGATGVTTTTVVTATFSEMMKASSVNVSTFELRDAAGALVPATVSAGGETPTASLTPSVALATGTRYTATVKGGAAGVQDLAGNTMSGDVQWSFTTAGATPPPPTLCPCTIWNSASTTASGPDSDTGAVELGVRFKSDVDGVITALRFYKHASNTGTHIGNLWTNTGTLLASATYVTESASGWQTVYLPVPVPIAKNTMYVASYHTNTGHYAANGGYFSAAGFDNVPLHAVPNGLWQNGVYRYGATSGFPNQSWIGTNYWVDVVFDLPAGGGPDVSPPGISSIAPMPNTTNVSPTGPITATFTEPMDPATITTASVELRDPFGALVPTTVTYAVPTGTAIMYPNSPLAYSTRYTATVRGGIVDPRVKDLAGNAMGSSFSWGFTTAPPPQTCPCTIWGSTMPALLEPDGNAVEVGVRFRSETNGYITGLRFYKGLENTGTHVGSLWTNTGVLLARATFISESNGGWQQVNFATPVAISADITYVASYHTNTGHYAINPGYFASGFDSPPLHAWRDGVAGANGVYAYSGAPTFPNQTYNSANYWVDVVFDTKIPADVTAPAVTTVTPFPGATGVAVNSVVTATFTEMMAAASFTATSFELRDAAGTLVPATIMVGGETPTVTLTPNAALAYGTTYTATVKGGASGGTDLAGNMIIGNYSWSFTTVSAPNGASCPCSIWSAATLPAGPDADPQSIEIGVKFQSGVAGYITAIRFYKFASNSGPHVAELWSRNGVRLASVAVTNETTGGWQTVVLPSPVPIAANTTYIAAYHTTVGRYAVNNQFFVTGVTNGPLRALADGEDGGNGVYRYGPAGTFPDQTYHGENYWVDVVFSITIP